MENRKWNGPFNLRMGGGGGGGGGLLNTQWKNGLDMAYTDNGTYRFWLYTGRARERLLNTPTHVCDVSTDPVQCVNDVIYY